MINLLRAGSAARVWRGVISRKGGGAGRGEWEAESLMNFVPYGGAAGGAAADRLAALRNFFVTPAVDGVQLGIRPGGSAGSPASEFITLCSVIPEA